MGLSGDLATAAALVLLDAKHHPLAVDFDHLEVTELTATQPPAKSPDDLAK